MWLVFQYAGKSWAIKTYTQVSAGMHLNDGLSRCLYLPLSKCVIILLFPNFIGSIGSRLLLQDLWSHVELALSVFDKVC